MLFLYIFLPILFLPFNSLWVFNVAVNYIVIQKILLWNLMNVPLNFNSNDR